MLTSFLLLFWLLCVAPVSHAGPSFGPLLQDPAPKQITRDVHYIVSNESQQYLFRPHIENLGGVFVGVGADQVYVMAGWSKPEVLIPMDFDIYIVDLHKIYGLLFREAKTVEEFMTLWSKPKRKHVQQRISEVYPDKAARLLKIFNRCQPYIYSRLKKVQRIHRKKKIPVFVTDQEIYHFLRQLHLDGKVFPIRGDLTKDKAMQSISKAAEQAKVPVRTIYMSNAEQYFWYKDAFRKNFQDMFFDDKSVILRTIPAGDDYQYYVQNAKNFQQWIGHKKLKKVRQLFRYRSKMSRKIESGYLLKKTPPASWSKEKK